MVKHITLDSVEYPITDTFADEIANLKTTEFKMAEVEAARLTLLKMSEYRKLSKKDIALLGSLTHLKNVKSAIRFAQGRSLSEFGFDGWDQVHGNRCTHACGCATHYIFDHHKARAEEKHKHHPHHPHHVCDEHAHLANDFRKHFATLHPNSE